MEEGTKKSPFARRYPTELRERAVRMVREEVALGYRQLLQVERGWRDRKQHLELRPMFQRKEDRIRSHILLCFLGLLLVRVAENGSHQTWERMRRELQRVCLASIVHQGSSRSAGGC